MQSVKTIKSPVIIELNENRLFRQAGIEEWLPAEVPGTVHTDLLANGLIGDFIYCTGEDDVQWIEDEDWEYRTTFMITP